VRAPNGRVAILQQTDYGPSAAGRIVDINAVAARTVFGLPQGNAFPTGQGTWTIRFLGQQRPANAATAAQGADAAATTAAPVAAAASCMPCPDTAPAAATTLALAPQVDPAGVPNARGGAGFTPAPGTDYSVGEEPQLASHLDALGRALGIRLTGVSGYRSPQHSIAVGGFPNDPHTRGEASDTDGAQTIPEATLEQFGLTRPFPGAHEADHIQLLGSAGAGAATLVSAGQAPSSACQSGGTVPLAPGDRARILPSGLAEAPANAPPAVKAMIAAGNQLIGLPYLWGGGHGNFDLAADKTGVDCSGAVSWLLHAGGLLATPWDSTTLEGFQAPGSGLWVTIFANSGHTFLYVAGIRMDTAPQAGDGPDSQDGPRWRPATRSTAGFVARHPAAL
jgi:cell wall-associated NlpC family hydrolase